MVLWLGSSISSCSNGCRVLDGMRRVIARYGAHGLSLLEPAHEVRCDWIFCALGLFALGHAGVFTENILLDAVSKLAYKLAWSFEHGRFNACT